MHAHIYTHVRVYVCKGNKFDDRDNSNELLV